MRRDLCFVKTKEESKFYPSLKSRCKACQKEKASGCDRNPKTTKEVKCIECKKISLNPIEDFHISITTGLYLDKCKTCRSNPLELENIQVQKNIELDLQRKQELYLWAKNLQNNTKKDSQILSVVFKELAEEL